MKHSISTKLLKNYVSMFLISTLLVFIAYCLLLLADGMLNKKLVSQVYTAEYLMKDDYDTIQVGKVLKHNGSIQVIKKDLEVIHLGGPPILEGPKLTTKEWTDFLISSSRKDAKYNYSIAYNESENFWLVITFPVSLRIYFMIVTNNQMISTDLPKVLLIIGGILSIYIIMLSISTLIYAKISSSTFIKPLKELCRSTKRLAEGNYEERVDLHLTAEFAELQENFNHLARQLEIQTKCKEASENLRRRMILDVSHDLKNPLSSIMGYGELCLQGNLNSTQQKKYMEIIYNNSIRANKLITDLFQLSKLDSPDFQLSLEKVDVCEFLRKKISDILPLLEDAGLVWDFNIPEVEIMANIDRNQMDRVFFNLFTNAIKYNPTGTEISVKLSKEHDNLIIEVSDNGIGIRKECAEEIFEPFVRADQSRNSKTGGSGLGLTIVKKIIQIHGGTITLKTDKGCGCHFKIILPI